MNHTNGFRPIFVVGPERSGTTLLAALIDRHSQVAVTPETHFLYPHTMLKLAPATGRGHAAFVDVLFQCERIPDLGLDRQDVLRTFQQYPAERPYLFRALLETYKEYRAKPRVGEKSPHHLMNVATIFEWFPEARVVAILRDGRDCMRSLRDTPWAHDNLRLHATVWRQCAELTRQWLRQYPRRFALVYYENLVCEPETNIRTLDDFLNLDFEPAQLDPSIQTGVVPDWESDWKGKVDKALDPSKIGQWRGAFTQEEKWLMTSVMADELRRHGYAEVSLHGCPLPKRAMHHTLNCYYRLRHTSPTAVVLKAIRHNKRQP